MSYGRTIIYSDAREITAANVVEEVSNAKCEESPCFYRGKVLGERSYTKSLDNFDAYVSEWKGEPNGMGGTPPFSIKSFLIFPSDCMDLSKNPLGEFGMTLYKIPKYPILR